jgi:hypothetical protein
MFEILIYLVNQGFINADLIDNKPAQYQTLNEAHQELQEHLLDTLESYQSGDLQDEYSPEDYLIKHTKTFETYHVAWNSDKTGINLVNPVDFIKAS